MLPQKLSFYPTGVISDVDGSCDGVFGAEKVLQTVAGCGDERIGAEKPCRQTVG